jgi:NADPH:quinone reductase
MRCWYAWKPRRSTSDLGVLIPGADMTTATVEGTPERPIVTASLGAGALAGLSARIDKPLPVGNEGAGTVVVAGSSSAAQALLGKTVGIAGCAMYTQYRVVDASACLVLPAGATAKDGASSFVNPLTALGMVETMRREGHSGLVHTAAASNLGQMLVKLCIADGVPLVNIVRKPDQEELLRSLGAVHVCNSSSPSFTTDLVAALQATSATLAFDATGWRNAGEPDSQRYGGSGQLDRGGVLTVWVDRQQAGVHLRWTRYQSDGPHQELRHGGGVGGRLLTPFLQNAGAETVGRLRARVAAELTTTFASTYTREVSLAGMLRPDAFNDYVKRATGEKFLVTPNALP